MLCRGPRFPSRGFATRRVLTSGRLGGLGSYQEGPRRGQLSRVGPELSISQLGALSLTRAAEKFGLSRTRIAFGGILTFPMGKALGGCSQCPITSGGFWKMSAGLL